MRKLKVYIAILLCLHTYNSNAQQADSLAAIGNIPSRYYSDAGKKLSEVNEKLTKKSLRYLRKFQKQEERLQRKLQQVNPNTVINKADSTYSNLAEKIKSKTGIFGKTFSGLYNPYLDTLGSSLSFLKQVKDAGAKAGAPLQNFNELENKMQQAGDISAFIAQRQSQLQQSLSQISNLTPGLKNQFDKLNKTAYYYSAQVKEYKDMLHDPDKLEQKTLSILSQLPAFQKYMKENSQLGNLFGIPANYSGQQAVQGLQTLDEVRKLIAGRVGSGSGAMQTLQSQMQAAQGELNKFKDKLTQLGGGSGDIEMPDFTPQNYKTRPFLQRLEYSTDLQTTRGNYGFPTNTSFGLSAGYKLKNKITVGLGISYIQGWGTDIQHIAFTSEGVGLRSFFEYKLKKNFEATGGFEYNYEQPFKLSWLTKYNGWQQSGLIGISKTLDIKSKVFKKTNVELLWDFLSYYQIPRADPFEFRIGYTF